MRSCNLIPLGAPARAAEDFAGRRVLLTLSAEELTEANVLPSHLLTTARFDNVRVEGIKR